MEQSVLQECKSVQKYLGGVFYFILFGIIFYFILYPIGILYFYLIIFDFSLNICKGSLLVN